MSRDLKSTGLDQIEEQEDRGNECLSAVEVMRKKKQYQDYSNETDGENKDSVMVVKNPESNSSVERKNPDSNSSLVRKNPDSESVLVRK